MDFISDLKWRGIINNITNEDKLASFLKNKGRAYIGFDPSGKSLHLGNYIMLLVLKKLKKYGHNPIALIGGATGLIGDPSGKTQERALQDNEVIAANAKCIAQQIEKFAQCETFNNIQIYQNLNLMTFFRDIGKYVSINNLLEKEIIAKRLTTGITYAEFSYNILQANDFLWLYQNKQVVLQLGGSDQWGNITSGIDLIRKKVDEKNECFGITINLLTKKNGEKFGKSEKGAIFLDPALTSPYEMYNFLLNQQDEDVEKLLRMLTSLEQEQINKIMEEHKANPSTKLAQRKLSEQVLIDIHGQKELDKCLQISEALFKGTIDKLTEDNFMAIAKTIVSYNCQQDNLPLAEALLNLKIIESKSEFNRLVANNAIKVNGQNVTDTKAIINKNDALLKKYSLIRKGKKEYGIICWL